MSDHSPPEGGESPLSVPTPDASWRPLAAWWKRLVAIVIDGLLVSVATGLVMALLFGLERDALVTNLVSFSAAFAYKTCLEARLAGQTLGKMALRIQVRDNNTGGPLELNRSLVRSLVYFALFIPYGIPGIINGLSPLWDKRRQSWHDKAAKTVVVDRIS